MIQQSPTDRAAIERLLAFARGGPLTWRRDGAGGPDTDYNALRADILAAIAGECKA